MRHTIRLRSAALFLACATALALPAVAQDTHQVSVPAGDLTDALQQYVRQTGVELVYRPEQLKGLKTRGVQGTLEPVEALNKLIEDTTLELSGAPGGVLLISKPDRGGTGANRPGSTPPPRDGMTAPGTGSTAPRGQDRTQEGQETSASTGAGVIEMERLTVTGSRLRSIDVEGPAPVTVFDRERIDQLGVSSVADVLRYLPQQPFMSDAGAGQALAGAQSVQLRGLGFGTTLVLVNGRRTVTSALQAGRNFFDLNSVPLAAVERIEVLSNSASAVYGADAVGGVVNIILKDAIPRPVVELSYGTANGGGEERRVSFAVGHAGERLRASLLLDVFDRAELPASERSYLANNDYRRFDSLDTRTPFSNPGNVCAVSGNLPGLPTPCAAVPAGSSGIGLTPADFLATAGQTNLDSPWRFDAVVPEARRYALMGTAEVDVADTVTAFGELLYTDRSDVSPQRPTNLSNRLVPASNAFNPFDVDVRVNYLFEGIGRRLQYSDVESLRTVAGLTGWLGHWDWEVSMLGTRETGDIRTENQLDQAAVETALASSDPAQALNVFQDGPGGSAALLASLVAPAINDEWFSSAVQIGAFMRGRAFALPAGDVDLVVGIEARKEKIEADAPASGISIAPDRRSESAYAEMRIPFAPRANLTLAGRYDRYSDFGGTFNPQYGLEWRPLPSLLLRASYGRSFRAPSLFELYQPAAVFPALLPDPARNNELASFALLVGGNHDLQPERADSLTVGFVFTPVDSALRAAASYWEIEQQPRVLRGSFAPPFLANEALFTDRIVRAEPTPEDIAAGLPGRLISVDSSNLNAGRLETSGIDLELSHVFDTTAGRFSPSLATTWVREYRSADFPGTPLQDRLGLAQLTSGTIPQWRATASLAWNRGGLGAVLTARYVDAYDDAHLLTPNGRTVDSQTLVDLQGSLDFGQLAEPGSWLSGIVLRAGILNLFDREPPYSEIRRMGYDSALGDPRQRFGYLRISKSF